MRIALGEKREPGCEMSAVGERVSMRYKPAIVGVGFLLTALPGAELSAPVLTSRATRRSDGG